MRTMVIAPTDTPPPPFDAALKEQQKADIERSLECARSTLGLEIAW
jgi:hypothetical protein